jgi:hypothetical protein
MRAPQTQLAKRTPVDRPELITECFKRTNRYHDNDLNRSKTSKTGAIGCHQLRVWHKQVSEEKETEKK